MIAAVEDRNLLLEDTDQDQDTDQDPDMAQDRGMVQGSAMVRDQVSVRVLAQWAERLSECQET
jgi:hypothetical protein